MQKTTFLFFIIIALIVIAITSATLSMYNTFIGSRPIPPEQENNLQLKSFSSNGNEQLSEEKIVIPQHVLLYYPNSKQNPTIDVCSQKTLLPVTRTIDGHNPIQETMELLINGDITGEERDLGFQTEFPHEDFKLIDIKIQNETLTLTFTEIPGFTTGGSCRTGLLYAQIEKTALQFHEIKRVIIQPETLFQP
ncbi:MAG: GerMN domain-containing protein [bacterium]